MWAAQSAILSRSFLTRGAAETKARHILLEVRLWVINRNARIEQFLSAIPKESGHYEGLGPPHPTVKGAAPSAARNAASPHRG